MAKFACPGCGVALRISEEQFGKALRCPKCKKRVKTPDPPAASEPEPENVGATREPQAEAPSFELPRFQTSNVEDEPPPEESTNDDWDGDDWEEGGLDELPVDAEPPVRRSPPPYSRPTRWGIFRPKRGRFWLLQLLVSGGYINAVIVLVLSLISGVAFPAVVLELGPDADAYPVVLTSIVGGVVGLFLGVLIVIPLLIYIQLLDCFLAIEENTRSSDR